MTRASLLWAVVAIGFVVLMALADAAWDHATDSPGDTTSETVAR
jgi:hypothetical protein